MRTLTIILGLTATTLFGCQQHDANSVSADSILGDLSPELLGMVERPIDARANSMVTADVNSRMFFDDIGRVLYTDHPSRLHPLPIISTSGSPR